MVINFGAEQIETITRRIQIGEQYEESNSCIADFGTVGTYKVADFEKSMCAVSDPGEKSAGYADHQAVCGCQKERCPVLYIYGSSGSGRASEGEEESGACAGSTSGEVPDSGKTGECFGH